MILVTLLGLCVAWLCSLTVLTFIFRRRLQKQKSFQKRVEDRISIGLFHPYCNAGSGAERVLWVALKCLQTRYPSSHFILYTGDSESPSEILAKASHRFNLSLPGPVDFVYLHKRKWVEARSFPYFTLVGQALGSIYLGLEALFKFVPDVYIDTMGYTFTLPVFKYLGKARVATYIHSPTLTTDMLHRVSLRTFEAPSYAPRPAPSPYSISTMTRLFYYKVFAKFYRLAGRAADIVMVNSSWTEEHVNLIWQVPARTYRVYPPCDIEGFKGLVQSPSEEREEEDCPSFKIISIGQFKPEKDHPLQIRTLYQLRELLKEDEWSRVVLVIIGSTRGKEDLARVKDMEDLCKHLSVEANVRFKVDLSYEELRAELSSGLIGLHTAWNEQFGIGIVESMAAGLIMVANRSAGPMMDIVMEYDGARNGFLATDENDYAEAIRGIMHMTWASRKTLQAQAIASVDRFSERHFNKCFLEAVQTLLPL